MMSDLISRQAAIAEFSCCELTPDGGIDVNYAIDFLKCMPPAQPEIIRCKDCKWKQGSECVRFAEVRPFPDDFCSRAERREE